MRSRWVGSAASLIALAAGAVASDAGCSQAPAADDGQLCAGGYIESLYRNVFDRAPDDGLSTWQARYDRGWTRRKLALAFLESTERRTKFIHQVFFDYLRRSPTDAEVAYYMEDLRAGFLEEDIIAALAGSDEYYDMIAELDRKQFVAMLYQDILGRAASHDEIAEWADVDLEREDIAYELLGSDEYITKLVTSFYQYYLQRMPQNDELHAWVNAISSGSLPTELVRASFLASPEYLAYCPTAAQSTSRSADAPRPLATPCGDIHTSGTCSEDGGSAIYCEAGQLFEESCPAGCDSGLCFDDSADTSASSDTDASAEVCEGGVTDKGQCAGSVFTTCAIGALRTQDCATDGRLCVVQDGYADCEAPPTPCGSITEAGVCDGNAARFCDDGSVDVWDCALEGLTCRIGADQRADCVDPNAT